MKDSQSTSKKLLGNILAALISVLIYFGVDYLTPYLKQSPVFNGVMSMAGVGLLLALPLLPLGDRRPFAPGEWLPIAMEIFGGTLLGLGMVLYGLSFWFHGLEGVAFVLLGLFAVVATVLIILIVWADKKRSLKKDVLLT